VAQLSEVTAPGYLEGLEEWPLEEVRIRRADAHEIETGLSYLRRMVQGRLDIVVAEQRHGETGERVDVSELVEELPAILSGNVHAPGLGRLPTLMAPGEIDADLERRLEQILPPARLANLSDLAGDELLRIAAELAEFERSVSTTRRSVLDVLDRLEEEIVRRYRDGGATVDSLLP
jgi:hypothetical protein